MKRALNLLIVACMLSSFSNTALSLPKLDSEGKTKEVPSRKPPTTNTTNPAANPPAVASPPSLGYQLVVGAGVSIPPLALVEVIAQCPSGKVALSAGYKFGDLKTPRQEDFGFEVRGAIPDGSLVRVLVRNANVFVSGTATALAVCVNAIPGLREINNPTNRSSQTSADSYDRQLTLCNSNEVLVGGGTMGNLDTIIGENQPSRVVLGYRGGVLNTEVQWGWSSLMVSTSLVAVNASYNGRSLCAPRTAVNGWEFVNAKSPPLPPQSHFRVSLGCPVNKVMLAVGAGTSFNTTTNVLWPVNSSGVVGTAWDAMFHNRELELTKLRQLLDRPSSVESGSLSAICVQQN
jgi:hypothetical protein